MLVEKIEFNVEVKTPAGATQRATYEKLCEICLSKNKKGANRVLALLDAMKRVREGETVSGDDIQMKGFTFRRID